MFDHFIHFWFRYIGDVGAWHARSNYPRNEHGIPMPTYGGAPVNAIIGESNVTPLRVPTEERHG